MKPDEAMHTAMEEVDLDPCDLYTSLGTLIVEGRLPGLTDRGFGEGPHCCSPSGQGPVCQNRHQCDPASAQCQKYDEMLKHMLLLWKNCIPMTIEVLLYPTCCSQSLENVEGVPDIAYLLLEQWTIHMLPRRVPDASISPRGLIQAVRSFLYFSQLCAWFSLSGGKSPRNIHYRVCVPGEAFSSKFSTQPDFHVFPVANVGRNAAMKVITKSHPRVGEIPVVLCYKHSKQSNSSSPSKESRCRTEQKQSLFTKNEREEGEYLFDGILQQPPSRTSSPALGESLLDPPNSLCMYPKRYQSPSRCGSPSIEVPEHLMFGKSKSNLSDQQEGDSNNPKRRSRPQRRPVVERFLKIDLDKKTCDRTSFDEKIHSTLTKKVVTKSDILLKTDNVLRCCCLEDCLKDLPREEMEQVLERLHEQCTGCDRKKTKINLHNKSLSHLIDKMKINSHLLEQKDINAFYSGVKNDSCCCDSSKNMFKQALRLNKENSTNRKSDKNTAKFTIEKLFSSFPNYQCKESFIADRYSSQYAAAANNHHNDNNNNNQQPQHMLENRLNLYQSKNYIHHDKEIINKSQLMCVPEQQDTSLIRMAQKTAVCDIHTYHQHDKNHSLPHQIHPEIRYNNSSINKKKCNSAFFTLDVASDVYDERKFSALGSTNSSIKEDVSPVSFIIPSAEKKALFRRSLDSATSLVFHQRSGLPLTSSPAPVRKSGTCFDFDSSLTSVSAIKRALFEKDPEESVEKEDVTNLSNSAPASIANSSLLGTFEESVLNGRLEPVSTVEGFTAEIGASGSFCPRHITLPVTVFFYTLQDMDKVTSPYLGHINLRNKDYHIPKKGAVQVTLFNPHHTVVKMFVVRYDLSDMPVNCQTFLRQRTLYMPSDALENDPDAQKWLRYLIHLRFMSSKSGRIYLHTDIRVIIFRKSDLDAATVHGQRPYELRSFTHGPLNPKFSPHKP